MSRTHASPFVHNVADLRRHGASKRRLVVEAPVEWHVQLSRVLPEPPLVADLELHPTSGGIVVRGSVSFTARHICHRCLEEFDEESELNLTALFAEEDLEDEDDYELSGDEIDLEQMLRDEVMLSMPLLPTSPKGCGQLVTTPESDLNTESSGAEGESRSPFAVLKDLFPPAD